MHSCSFHLCQYSWHWSRMYGSQIHTHQYLLKYKWKKLTHTYWNMFYLYLTWTLGSIASVTWVAGAGKTPLCVCTLRILMTVVQVSFTLINICITKTQGINALVQLVQLTWFMAVVGHEGHTTSTGMEGDGILQHSWAPLVIQSRSLSDDLKLFEQYVWGEGNVCWHPIGWLELPNHKKTQQFL